MYKKIAVFLFSFFPLLASAFTKPTYPLQSFKDIINIFGYIIQQSIPVVISFLVVLFLFNMTRFVLARAAGDEKRAEYDKKMILWWLLAITVAFSIWGFTSVIGNTFFEGLPSTPPTPQVII